MRKGIFMILGAVILNGCTTINKPHFMVSSGEVEPNNSLSRICSDHWSGHPILEPPMNIQGLQENCFSWLAQPQGLLRHMQMLVCHYRNRHTEPGRCFHCFRECLVSGDLPVE
jgi:hypothetical protein